VVVFEPMLHLIRQPILALGALCLIGKVDVARAAETARPLVETICPLMEKEAEANGISAAFFVRLIWRESAFRPNTVSHKGAQGIAQFMPATAKERGLEDPFDPVSAISHSARLLADHIKTFGNFGLAAAAYNAGPERVRGWLDGRRTLPAETRNYVRFITGHAADRWKEAGDAPAELATLTSEELQEACRKRAPALIHAALPSGARSKPQQSPPPWGVQLASDFSQAKVAGMFNVLKQRHAKVLAEAEPLFMRGRNLSRGRRAMVTLRIGAANQPEALKLCERLRADGGTCTVHRN
jgi:hypothetical protein